MKKLVVLASLMVIVTGCSAVDSSGEIDVSEEPEVTESVTLAPSVEDETEEFENLWQSRCANYVPISGQPWHAVYNEVIADICSSTVIEPDVLEVIYSPAVNQSRLKEFVETAEFSFNFWRPKTLDTEPVKLILLTEKEQDWFEETLTPLLKDPSVLEWFSPDAKGVGRCGAVDSQGACGAKYPVWETTTGTLVYVNLLGTMRVPDDEYKIDAAHNAVHWYQDSHGFQHWDYGFLEGQATLHEIAFHILYTGNDRKREDGAWSMFANDNRPFKATTVEETIEHHKICSQDSRECNSHFYFGGAMQQEKIIIDFGYPRYLEWLTAVESVRSNEAYEATFQEVFDVEMKSWQEESWAPYLLDSILHYRETRWGE